MADLSFTSFSGTTRPTALQIYDSDPVFQADADKMVYHVQRNLGTPVLDSELDLRQIWGAFEQATLEYSQTINTYHARNILLDLIGQGTGSLSGSEQVFPIGNTTEFARKLTFQYSSELGTGGPFVWQSSSINLVAGQQRYDLWTPLSGVLTGANENKNIIVRRVFHYEPTAAFRFFDTTSVLNFLGNAMNFESYSPETIFYLLPIWEDVLRGTQLSLNQRVRRSNYSFELKGNELMIFPTPTKAAELFLEYTIGPRDPVGGESGTEIRGHLSKGVVSNLSNIAFGHIGYGDMNSMAHTWIWRMTLAFSKEILGQIRSKYKSMPIPGSDITLNGPELIAQGREEQANLRLELKEILLSMSYKNLLEEKVQLNKTAVEEFKNIPLLIYRSR